MDYLRGYEAAGMKAVWIDESGFSQDNFRARGYAEIGERCYATYDWGKKERVNVIGAMMEGEVIEASSYKSTINGDVFSEWMEERLLPKLTGKEVLIMDNASFHKRKSMLEAIIKKGCSILFLPPYMPDLNKIEYFWAECKACRRRTRCSVEELFTKYFPIVDISNFTYHFKTC